MLLCFFPQIISSPLYIFIGLAGCHCMSCSFSLTLFLYLFEALSIYAASTHPAPSLLCKQERDYGCHSHWETLHADDASVKIFTVLIQWYNYKFCNYYNHDQDIFTTQQKCQKLFSTSQPLHMKIKIDCQKIHTHAAFFFYYMRLMLLASEEGHQTCLGLLLHFG